MKKHIKAVVGAIFSLSLLTCGFAGTAGAETKDEGRPKFRIDIDTPAYAYPKQKVEVPVTILNKGDGDSKLETTGKVHFVNYDGTDIISLDFKIPPIKAHSEYKTVLKFDAPDNVNARYDAVYQLDVDNLVSEVDENLVGVGNEHSTKQIYKFDADGYTYENSIKVKKGQAVPIYYENKKTGDGTILIASPDTIDLALVTYMLDTHAEGIQSAVKIVNTSKTSVTTPFTVRIIFDTEKGIKMEEVKVDGIKAGEEKDVPFPFDAKSDSKENGVFEGVARIIAPFDQNTVNNEIYISGYPLLIPEIDVPKGEITNPVPVTVSMRNPNTKVETTEKPSNQEVLASIQSKADKMLDGDNLITNDEYKQLLTEEKKMNVRGIRVWLVNAENQILKVIYVPNIKPTETFKTDVRFNMEVGEHTVRVGYELLSPPKKWVANKTFSPRGDQAPKFLVVNGNRNGEPTIPPVEKRTPIEWSKIIISILSALGAGWFFFALWTKRRLAVELSFNEDGHVVITRNEGSSKEIVVELFVWFEDDKRQVLPYRMKKGQAPIVVDSVKKGNFKVAKMEVKGHRNYGKNTHIMG